MTYPLTVDLPIGIPGLALLAQFYNEDGLAVAGQIVDTGFHEAPAASGFYGWTHDLPVGFQGSIVFRISYGGNPGMVVATIAINPAEVENPYLDLLTYGVVDDAYGEAATALAFLATALAPSVFLDIHDHYIGGILYFIDGPNATLGRRIVDYDGDTGLFTMSVAFPRAPVTGNRFVIVGRSE